MRSITKFIYQGGGQNNLPLYLDVELTNLCNFRCCFCPTGTKSMLRMRGTMPDNVAEALIENVRRYKIAGVRFIRWGEPTLHPKYIDIMEQVKKVGALIHINTNGSLLDETQMQRLMDIHLDSIKFSFQGADEGTYNEMREGGDYLKLLHTIRRFHEIRGDRDYPYIQISTTLTAENDEQIESFKNDVGDYCDYYNIGHTKLNHLKVEAMNVSDAEKEKIRKLQEQETINKKYRDVCPEAFDKLSINWNGDVTLCCTDYDNFMIVGNILDNDIKQIFNSNAAKIYREAIMKKQYTKIKCCSDCYETVPLTK
ncbi:MAG: radical SAM protein [Selenomonadaceae bacterium]|nr:radical SAM protein [Selenomonadaceae bacterium]